MGTTALPPWLQVMALGFWGAGILAYAVWLLVLWRVRLRERLSDIDPA